MTQPGNLSAQACVYVTMLIQTERLQAVSHDGAALLKLLQKYVEQVRRTYGVDLLDDSNFDADLFTRFEFALLQRVAQMELPATPKTKTRPI